MKWYEEGLRFECTGCGDCCRGEPGYVWVSPGEVERMAACLEMCVDDFAAKCLRRVGARLSLLEKANGDCILWESSAGCTVYEARPAQCRTFPFWPENIRSRLAWRKVAERCRGIGRGRLYAEHEIDQLAGLV